MKTPKLRHNSYRADVNARSTEGRPLSWEVRIKMYRGVSERFHEKRFLLIVDSELDLVELCELLRHAGLRGYRHSDRWIGHT